MTPADELARLTRLTRYFARQVTAGDLVTQSSDAQLARMTPRSMRAYLDALLTVRKEVGDALVVCADTCLDEFTDHGHCGPGARDGRPVAEPRCE